MADRLAVVALLLAGGKISDLMDDVANGIKGFKSGLADDEPASPAPPSELRNERPDPV